MNFKLVYLTHAKVLVGLEGLVKMQGDRPHVEGPYKDQAQKPESAVSEQAHAFVIFINFLKLRFEGN